MADILGSYPQVYGYFYVNTPIVVAGQAYQLVTFDSTIYDINAFNTSGIITADYWGVYLVETIIQYTKTPNGVYTHLRLSVNDTPYVYSNDEADAEVGTTHSRRSIFTQVYIPESTGTELLNLKVFIYTDLVGGVTIGGSDTSLNNCIRVSRLR